MELYLLGLTSSGRVLPPTKAAGVPTIEKQLTNSANELRRVADLAPYCDGQLLSRASKRRIHSLRQFGFQNLMPALRWVPFIDNAIGEAINKAILAVLGGFIAAQSGAHSQGILPLQLKRISLRPAPSRFYFISKAPNGCFGIRNFEPADLVHGNAHGSQGKDEHIFHCPVCDYTNDVFKSTFDMAVLSKQTWCGICKRNRPNEDWRCMCGLQWYTCANHCGPLALVKKKAAQSIASSYKRNDSNVLKFSIVPKDQHVDIATNDSEETLMRLKWSKQLLVVTLRPYMLFECSGCYLLTPSS